MGAGPAVVASPLLSVQSSMTDARRMMTRNPSKNNFTNSGLRSSLLCFRYSSFVRIGSGLSFADYVWVRDKPWKTWDPKNPPDFLQTAKKSHEDKGDVYLLPEEYILLRISTPRTYLSKAPLS